MTNVIVFPPIKYKALTEEAHQFFKLGKYEKALDLYDQLLIQGFTTFEIHMNYLISLKMSEQTMDVAHFALEFVGYYTGEQRTKIIEFAAVTLFETERYSDVTMLINDLLSENISTEDRKQLSVLLAMANEQTEQYAEALLSKLAEAIRKSEHEQAYRALEMLHSLHIQPHEAFSSYLMNPDVHPVIKTMLLETYTFHKNKDDVTIEKFGKQLTIKPNEIFPYDEKDYVKKLLQGIEDLQQHNPSLHKLIKEMIMQYSYVMYPFENVVNDNTSLIEAFIFVGKSHLSILTKMEQVDERVLTHISNIEICLKLYASMTISEF